MKFGINQIKKAIPKIVKRIALVAGAISLAIGGYGLVSDNEFFKQVGGWSLIVSAGLPPLFGTTEKKEDEQV